MVVSVVTMCNQVLWQALEETLPGTPYITVMIDFADEPPGFWIEPRTDSYIVCGKPRAIAQAKALGVKAERIVATSGMVIHPRFQPPDAVDFGDIARSRMELGLAPDRLTGLVMFGGNGADTMLKIAQKLEIMGDRLQLIFLCGHHQALIDKLAASVSTQKHLAIGFTSDVPKYMALADFFIGKPGPGSLSEALAMNLPVVTERNFSTLIHERYNATWIEQENMGIVLRHFSQIADAVEQLLDPATLDRYQQAVSRYNNRAVYEVCDLIEALLANREANRETNAGGQAQ
ncbi:MAG: hypothetical protein HC800_00060 [Phormidesmis sp. RL_2_1]|nr:hypothetical protein [Phormidesmis sp. RL_2_1]